MKNEFKNIKLQSSYFDEQIDKHSTEKVLSQIYICGPPSMNIGIGKIMLDNNVDYRLYHFM